MADGRPLRFRFWVNEHLVYDSPMTSEEAVTAAEEATGLLRPHDDYLIVVSDRGGREVQSAAFNPMVDGSDVVFADKVVRELFPGLKLPLGEARWQLRHGRRYAPAPPDVWDEVGG